MNANRRLRSYFFSLFFSVFSNLEGKLGYGLRCIDALCVIPTKMLNLEVVGQFALEFVFFSSHEELVNL
jgi:hypothetical protein